MLEHEHQTYNSQVREENSPQNRLQFFVVFSEEIQDTACPTSTDLIVDMFVLYEIFTHSSWAHALFAASPKGRGPFLGLDNGQECSWIHNPRCRTSHQLYSELLDLFVCIAQSICPLQHLPV